MVSRNRRYSPANRCRTIAVIGIVALLAVLWSGVSWWGVGTLQATGGGQPLAASPASRAAALAATSAAASDGQGAGQSAGPVHVHSLMTT